MHIVAWLSPSYITRNRKKGNTYEKIDELINVWATEFFIWYVPNYWYEKFGFELSPNWRQSAQAQIQSYKEFEEVTHYIQSKGWQVLMTLNSNSYNKSIWETVKKLIDDAINIWVNGLIVSDLWVLDYLKEINYKGHINLSTIFNIYNNESIKFFLENYKINRFVLPREVTLKEIKHITSSFPRASFEVFLSGDKCIWNNGSCFTEHNTNWWVEQFKDSTSWNPHSYCQFIETVYENRASTVYQFRKLISDSSIPEEEKFRKMNNTEIDDLNWVWKKLLSEYWKLEIDYIKKQYNWFKNKSILVYDNSLSEGQKYNEDIISFVRWFEINFNLLKNRFTKSDKGTLQEFIDEKKKMIDFWISFYNQRIKEYGLEYIKRVDTLEWNRNWFETLDFLKEIPNVASVKVPGRGKDIKHILDYITWTVNKEEYSIKNFLDYKKDNSTRKFNYYNSIENSKI